MGGRSSHPGCFNGKDWRLDSGTQVNSYEEVQEEGRTAQRKEAGPPEKGQPLLSCS